MNQEIWTLPGLDLKVQEAKMLKSKSGPMCYLYPRCLAGYNYGKTGLILKRMV